MHSMIFNLHTKAFYHKNLYRMKIIRESNKPFRQSVLTYQYFQYHFGDAGPCYHYSTYRTLSQPSFSARSVYITLFPPHTLGLAIS